MAKRLLTSDYRDGIVSAVEFLGSWSARDEVAPWDMADQFLSVRATMSQQQTRGFQDTVFHYLQMTLEGMVPSLDSDSWLRELEHPEAWKNG
jgi:hypothetical protein